MLWDRAHGIVADSRRSRDTKPSGIGKERVKSSVAAVVEIDVYPPIVRQNKVSNGIGSLDGKRVAIEGLEEPWVFGSNKLARAGIGPELRFLLEPFCRYPPGARYLILVVLMQIQTRLLARLPSGRYA